MDASRSEPDGAAEPGSSADAEGSAPHQEAILELVSRVTDRLVRTLDFDQALHNLIEGATEFLQAERASIMILDPETQTLSIKVAKGIGSKVVSTTRIGLGEGIAGSVAESGEPLLVEDVRQLSMWRRSEHYSEESGYQDHSALCVPLVIHGRVRGVMNFNHKRGGGPFREPDLRCARLIANQAAIALYSASLHQHYLEKQTLEHELGIARSIQERFLPSAPPQLPGFAFAARCIMCNQVGGDYYDFLPLGDDRLAVVIGDAAGHGVGSALLMVNARAAVRSSLARRENPSQCMVQVNKLLKEDSGQHMFMTMLIGVLDARERSFDFVSAGHNMPLLLRGGVVAKLPLAGSNIPLGIRSDLEFVAEDPIRLRSGDRLLLYTDGLWEATDWKGQRFGTEGLRGALKEAAGGTVEELMASVFQHAFLHRAAPQAEDDYTVIVIGAE